MAKGFWVSLPTPVDSAAGKRPRQATSAVIMMGRRRSSEASRVASRMDFPSRRNLLEGDERADRFGEDDTKSDGDREFEIAVEGEKNEENHENSERSDDEKLGL